MEMDVWFKFAHAESDNETPGSAHSQWVGNFGLRLRMHKSQINSSQYLIMSNAIGVRGGGSSNGFKQSVCVCRCNAKGNL